MALLLLVLFIVVPIGELALLLWIADKTHWGIPLGLVIATGICGFLLLRLQGVLTMRRIQRSLKMSDEPPTDPLIDAGLMLFAAGLLLTPGVLTDGFGLSLLFPPTRLLWRNGVKRWFRNRFQMVTFQRSDPDDSNTGHYGPDERGPSPPIHDDNVIDGEIVE